MATIKFTSIPPKTLSQAILSTATTFRISDILGWDNVDLTSASFGSVAFGAFLSADRTVLELFSFDPSTIANSSISFVDRGLDFTGQNTSITANKLDWPAGTTVQLGADTPQILTLLADLGGAQTFTGVKTFTSTAKPKYNTHPTFTADEELIDKKYADDLAIAGAPDASTTTKGIGKASVAPASPTNPIFVGDNDPRVPTQGENDALVGTSGTPSSSNKYVTDDDTSVTASGSKVIRWSGGAYPAGDGSSITGLAKVVDVQTFTANGTWTKPSGAKMVKVVVIGAGGGGGSGAKDNSTTTAGAGGGGGGAIVEGEFTASSLDSTVTVTVGTGGSGGSAVSSNSDGNDGSNGGLSSFGNWLKAGGGGGGKKGLMGGAGTKTQGGGGGGVLSSATLTTGGDPVVSSDGIAGQGTTSPAAGSAGRNADRGGATGGGGDATNAGFAGGSSIFGAPGGGGGGRGDNGSAQNGGDGGTTQSYTAGGGAAGGTGGATGGAGTAGSSNATLGKGFTGSGGGGGGGSQSGNGGDGGAGGIPGAGGGGGGSTYTGTNSGAGGAGGRGEVRVYTYF